MANRVWLGHFGKGIVPTPSNFGLSGDAPSHPELLDYLASRFMREGWSVKKLHRLLMLSATYQQQSEERIRCAQEDPENRLLWRQNRRRLDFEAMRDSLLFVSGDLDLKMGGPSVDLLGEPGSTRRTIYGQVDRQNLPGLYRTFDFANPDRHSPLRYVTTSPQQALFLMNSRFMQERAQHLSSSAAPERGGTPAERVTELYLRLFDRVPTPQQLETGVRFVTQPGWGARPVKDGETALDPWAQYAQALLMTNEFAFVD
jgi:hypothetical protein